MGSCVRSACAASRAAECAALHATAMGLHCASCLTHNHGDQTWDAGWWESGKSTGLKGGEPVFTHQVHRLAAFVATFRLRHARRLPGVRVWAEASDPGATAQKASPGQAATPLREGAHQRKYACECPLSSRHSEAIASRGGAQV